jgi:hypothetical protein
MAGPCGISWKSMIGNRGKSWKRSHALNALPLTAIALQLPQSLWRSGRREADNVFSDHPTA